MHEFKQYIINTCKGHLEEKIQSLNTIINEVTESSNSESKSSAGDKHETSKAMMQLEIEKLGTQLKEAELQLAEFEKINFQKTFQSVEQGCLVETNKGYFLIASSIGKIAVDDKSVFVISNKSPFAIALSGKQQGESISFNGVTYSIISVS
jgi:transcription elongation GreA/GreB family factor